MNWFNREFNNFQYKSKLMENRSLLHEIWCMVKDKKNVIGYSESLKKRIKNGKEIEGTQVMRIYVSKKEPTNILDENDIIPHIIKGIETDIVEIGKIKAQTTSVSSRKGPLHKNHDLR